MSWPRYLRAILLTLLLIPLNAYWIIQMERARPGPYPTSISLFANVLVPLTALLAFNALIRRWRPRWVWAPGELALIYCGLSVATGVAGMDFAQVLLQILGHAYHFASPSNRWERFFPYLPRWLVVTDKAALKAYHEGHSSLYLPANWQAWAIPVLAWGLFAAALLGLMLGLSLLFFQQWSRKERLTFPVLALPLEMVRARSPLWRQRLFWYGAAVAGGVELLNGLHFLFPFIPSLPTTQRDLSPFFTSKPWNAMGWTPIAFYPFAIGLGFLLPVDLLFSSWFFYWFWKGQKMLANVLAWDVNPEMPYISFQAMGGCIALVAFLVYQSRGHWRQVAAQVRRRRRPEPSEGRWLYHGTLGLLAVCTAILTGFSLTAGLSWWVMVLFFAFYGVILLTVTRIRAELGPPAHDFHLMGPELMLTRVWGTATLTPQDLGVLALYWWPNRAYRGLPMAHQMEGLKLAERVGLPLAPLAAFAWLAGVAGFFAAAWAFLHLGYLLGTAAKFASGSGYGWQNYGALINWLENPTDPDWLAASGMGVGFATCILLQLLRWRFLSFPFHPIGYLISSSWSINLIWMPLLISWLIKLAIIRHGGLRLYRQAIPFFLGLIFADCLVGSFWALLGVALDIPTYSFWGA